ncbi:hypothetical protein [Caballeronia mineralivorans]|jgi:hypothetical protein
MVSTELMDGHWVSRGARNWGTRPDSNELRALLENQMSLLNIG